MDMNKLEILKKKIADGWKLIKQIEMMYKYKQAKIYKIVCNISGKQYIGSTCKKLNKRLSGHRGSYKLYLQGKFNYVTSFEILKNGNYDIILIEKFPCKTKVELAKREGYYIETIECVNKLIAGRTMKEYYEENKEEIDEYQKQYKKDNKEYYKEYYKETCKNTDKKTNRRSKNRNVSNISVYVVVNILMSTNHII